MPAPPLGAGRWSGAMYDPGLDGSFQLNRGFRQARQLLVDIARLGLPAGCLYLDSISPQFIALEAEHASLRAGVRYCAAY
mmetsp:Transcript_19401/g.63398  ORF Transcript_19401/g.63398 Transcript_19401/m.63398 type:complete len:80 (-) Transcript_19401:145-384(-)